MAYFTKDFSDFFEELSENNTSQWFNENRKRYENSVKKPFAAFVEELIRRIGKLDPEVKIKPADAITRINKDIRFSKDKTPYNTHVGAIISSAGKKDKSVPGLYIQLSHEKIVLFGGAYVLEPAQLKKVRQQIVADPKIFSQLYNDKTFISHFGKLQGEKSKRYEPEFQKIAAKEPLIANKQFFFSTELKPSHIVKDDLTDTVMDYYKAARGLNRFLQNALKSK